MIRNFLFHRVGPDNDKLWPPMKTELFEKCISYITGRYKVVKIEGLPDYKKNTKENLATISFDDGFKDNFQYAVPILEKYHVKASFYVVTGCIDNNIPTWTYIVDYLFQNTAKPSLHIHFDFLPQTLRIKSLKTHGLRVAYAKKLKPFLKTLSHEQRELILNAINRAFDDVKLPGIMMSWDELRALHGSGHTVGSHTSSHGMLGTMRNKKMVKEELENSAKTILKEIGVFPKTISYPLGSYDQDTIRLSREVGYKMGLAVKQDVYKPENDTIFEIPRIELYNESWWKTRSRINHSLEVFKKIILYK